VREGFEVLAELTNRYTKRAELHAGGAVRMGPFDELPAVALPQAQLDLTRAIQEAFYAGAAFHASTNLPQRWVISVDEQRSLYFGEVCGRTVTLVTEPDGPIDLAAVAAQLPQRVPNPYVAAFLEEGLQLVCPTCHQYTPLPPTGYIPNHAGPCGPACDTTAAVAP
jgi:hypothetical protein